MTPDWTEWHPLGLSGPLWAITRQVKRTGTLGTTLVAIYRLPTTSDQCEWAERKQAAQMGLLTVSLIASPGKHLDSFPQTLTRTGPTWVTRPDTDSRQLVRGEGTMSSAPPL